MRLCFWVVSSVVRVFVGFWGGSSYLFLFFSCRIPFLKPGQGSGTTPLSEAQSGRFFVIVQFCPANALLSPEARGDQGTLFARNVVQGYVRVCVSYFIFLRCVYSTLFCCLNTFPRSGAVGVATFHPGYLAFPRLTTRLADAPWQVFRLTSPFC